MNLGNLRWADARVNTPGITAVGYYSLKADIDNFPLFKANPAGMGDHAMLESETGFTFRRRGFYTVYGTQQKGRVESENQGEEDCKTFLNRYTFVYPGTVEKAKGWCRQMNNSDVIFLARKINGEVVLIGHKYLRTNFKVVKTTGLLANSQKGCTVEVSCSHECAAPVYEGEIYLAIELVWTSPYSLELYETFITEGEDILSAIDTTPESNAIAISNNISVKPGDILILEINLTLISGTAPHYVFVLPGIGESIPLVNGDNHIEWEAPPFDEPELPPYTYVNIMIRSHFIATNFSAVCSCLKKAHS